MDAVANFPSPFPVSAHPGFYAPAVEVDFQFAPYCDAAGGQQFPEAVVGFGFGDLSRPG